MTRHLLLGFLIVVTPLLGQQPASPNDAGSSAVHPSGIAQSPQKPQHPRKDVATIAKETKGAVVSIVMADKGGQPIAQGSGFVVSRDGRIVTNYHVIKSGSSAVAKLPDGAFFTVDGVLAFDKERDVAVIKAHGNNFQTVTLGNSDRLQVGADVVAIGSPLSLESTVSNGIVSGIRRDEERTLLQITAPISHGSSGGPLFNMAGEVIGITSAAFVDGENLNFAVPINDAKRLLQLPAHALLAFPNEPEAPAVAPKASAPTDSSGPSLEETEQWMKDNVNLTSWPNLAVTVTGDGYSIIYGEYFACDNCSGAIYVGGAGKAVDIRDGQVHDWIRDEKSYDLKFGKCSMTVDDFDEIRESRGRVIDPDAPPTFKFNGSTTFDLQHYDPHVTVEEDLATEDLKDPKKGGLVIVGKGKPFRFDTASVKATPLSHYQPERPIFFYLAYPFADRFAEALAYAITLCGGKPERF